jgi:uncharacterized phage protein (TIGR01671 family)
VDKREKATDGGGPMNREIKFRAWIPEEKRMEHLEFHITAYGETISFGHEKHDWIIMQFTGLHDRNGKEIYEGDICKLYNSMGLYFIVEVRIVDGCAEIYVSELKQRDYLKCYTVNYAVDVIGNIYSNPELLDTK